MNDKKSILNNALDRRTASDIGALGNVGKLDPGGVLAAAMGRQPDPAELLLWAQMPSNRRREALSRIAILRRWTEEAGEITAAEAAENIGMAVNRFYEIAAAWKRTPTLTSVGSFAKKSGRKGPRLDGDVINKLQALLPDLVKANSEARTATLVGLLVAHPNLQGAQLPHTNTLRTMVEREKRRLKGEKQVGLRPGFDASACELLRPDGHYHVLFAVIDRTSKLILGFSLGEVGNSHSAYARAAQDALDRIESHGSSTLPWADTTDRVDIVVGTDIAQWKALKKEYGDLDLKPEFGLVESDRRYGRYLKLAVGKALDDIRLYPLKTEIRDVIETGNQFTDDEATAAIEVAVARHNNLILAQNIAKGAARPAPETLRVLEYIARTI